MAKEEIFIAVEVDGGKAVKTLASIKSEMKALRDSNTNLNKALKAGTINLKQYGEATSKNDVKLKNLSARYREATNAASGLTKAGMRFRDRLSGSLSKAIKGIGVALAGAFAGRAILQGIGKTIDIIKDFDQGAANLASVLGKTQKEIVALTKDAKRLGSVTAFTASEVSQLQTEFAKLGFKEQEILDATEATLSLAAATGTELAEAAAVAGATLGGFGLAADETQRVVDVMAKSFSISALDMEKFKESMKTAAPAARAVGVSVEETTALLGTMSKAGISGSKAGNALKNTFIELNKKGLTLEEGLNKVKNSQDKLGTATKLVGKIAATSFLTLAEGTETTKELTASLNNAGGAAEKMAKTQLDTLEGKTKLLTSAWEGFVLSLDAGDGAISRITGGILELTTSMLNLLTPSEGVAETFINARDSFDLMNKSMPALLDRYDELIVKTELTTEEQEELKNIISQVTDEFPLATTAMNKHGEAVEISTSRTRTMIEGQKAFNDELQTKAIEETTEDINDMSEELQELNKGFRFTANGVLEVKKKLERGSIFVPATAAQQKAFQEQTGSLQNRVKASNELLFVIRNGKRIVDEEQEEIEETTTITEHMVLNLKALKAQRTELNKQKQETSITDLRAISDINANIEALDRQILAIENFHLRRLSFIDAEEVKKIQVEEDDVDRFARETKRVNDKIALEEQLKEAKLNIADEIAVSAMGVSRILRNLADGDEKAQKRALQLQKAAAVARIAIELQKQLAFIKTAAFGNPLNIPTAGLAGVSQSAIYSGLAIAKAAVSTGVVLSQRFQDGGVIDGASHANGGVPFTVGGRGGFEAEGGEVILAKGITENPNLLSAASQLNVAAGGKSFFQDGGLLPDFTQDNGGGTTQILEAISEINFQPTVSVVEIQDAAASVTIAEQQATI